MAGFDSIGNPTRAKLPESNNSHPVERKRAAWASDDRSAQLD
jgi:hypothetical protein